MSSDNQGVNSRLDHAFSVLDEIDRQIVERLFFCSDDNPVDSVSSPPLKDLSREQLLPLEAGVLRRLRGYQSGVASV